MMKRQISMLAIVLLWVSAAVLFLAIDMVWLTKIARGLYLGEIGPLLLETPNIGPAIAFYVLYISGLTFFVLVPAYEANSIGKAFLLGAALGAIAYGTYDLTNLAVMRDFTTRIALIDWAWGTILTGSVSALVIAGARMVAR